MYAQGDDANGEPSGLSKGLGDLREFARGHPVRVSILVLLAKRAEQEGLTTRQVRERLPAPAEDRPISLIAYHLRVLLGAELVMASDSPGEAGGAIEKVWALA